jgi:type I restriction enzyme S subunit
MTEAGNGWPRATLLTIAEDGKNSIAAGPFGSNLGQKDYVPFGVPVVRGANLAGNTFVMTGFVHVTPAKADELARSMAHPGDIVVTQRGTLGQVALIPLDSPFERYILSQSQMKVSVNPERADAEFVYFALLAPDAQRHFQEDAIRSGVPHINLSTLRVFEIPLPPLFEQRAIAHALRTVQRARETTEQVLAAARELKRSLLGYLFTFGPLAPVDTVRLWLREGVGATVRSDWPLVSLREAATWLSGGTPSTTNPDYWGGGIPWLSASSMTDFFLVDSERRVTDLGARHGTRLVPENTTIAVVRGMSLRTEFRVGITTRKMAFGQDCKALIPAKEFNPLFFAYALKAQSPAILKMVDRSGHGTGRLGTDRLEQVEIPLPSAEEQELVSQILLAADRKIAVEEQRREVLEGLFTSLLFELMTGRSRVRDVAEAS